MSCVSVSKFGGKGGATGVTFRVLFICTGNICRSPSAERLLTSALAYHRSSGEVLIGSAGTKPVLDAAIEPQAARLLSAAGADVSGFSARLLTPSLLDEADLVLGLAREHRTSAAQMWPSALRRSFTLREFARLVSRITTAELADVVRDDAPLPDRLRAIADLAPLHRAPVAHPDLDDVPDPYGREAEAFEAAHVQIVRAVEAIVSALALSHA